MQEKCEKCDGIIEDRDLKTICFKCRKWFSDEIKELVSLEKFEEAKRLISSGPKNDRWKQIMLERIHREYEQFTWGQENQKRILEIEETRERERLLKLKEEKTERERRILETKDNHQKFLSDKGVKDFGVSTASTEKAHRVTHCYNCSANLDSAIDMECNGCHWIICDCGACGCAYVK